MALLITIFAAIICTVILYRNALRSTMKIGMLCLMYWGASLMWMIDAVFEYVQNGVEYFNPDPLSMLNDFYLGLSVVALGLIIWLVVLFIKDPEDIVKNFLSSK